MLLIPSIWYENSPNVILEAFAHGTPVIASNLGGMAELVRHNVDGLTFNAGDAQDLAHQITRVIDQPSLLQQFCANIPPVKTVAQEIDGLEAIYRRCTGAA
jgi:glycosyltransferase involved in cell wall biosynthesis